MIPLRDVIPSRSTPVVTMVLIALNAVVFVYQFTLADAEGQAFIFEWGLVPATFSLVNVVTSMFLHGGLLHFGGNMLYLWIFGDNVEDRMGHGRFVAFYLLCGAAAALSQTWASPDSPVPMVGASGAIAGVMGAYFLMYPHSRIVTLIPIFVFFQLVEIPALIFLGLWFLLQFLSGVGSSLSPQAGLSGGIAFWAHVAGFVAGMVAVHVFRRPERQRVEWWHDVER
jgi:membrane associated rhomboid family serine protease